MGGIGEERCRPCELAGVAQVADKICADAKVVGVDCEGIYEELIGCVQKSTDLDTSANCAEAYLDRIEKEFTDKGRPDLVASLKEVRSWPEKLSPALTP